MLGIFNLNNSSVIVKIMPIKNSRQSNHLNDRLTTIFLITNQYFNQRNPF